MGNDIKVLIADDHLLIRQGFKGLLNKQKGIKVLWEAVDGLDAIDKINNYNPDIVLLDINMPKMSGLEALSVIKERNPEQKVIVLTIHDSREYVQQCVNKGADGYISKDVDVKILKDAIIRVFNGESYIQPTMMKELMVSERKEKYNESSDVPVKGECEIANTLTNREYEVALEVAKGNRNKEIAITLDISEKTVRNHIYSIFKKLNITDRAQVILLLMEGKKKTDYKL